MSQNKQASTSTQFMISLQTGIPVLLNGMPGEAKTAYVQALSNSTSRILETVIASTRDPSDIGGLPKDCPNTNSFKYIPPSWAANIINADASGQGGILFFDEISCAPPSCQAGLLRVIHEKVVGETPLPQNTWIAAAMNPPEVAANGWQLSAPMANRFIHLNWTLSTETWIEGMLSGFKEPDVEVLPANWRDFIPSQRAIIASFIKAKPLNLRQFPKNPDEQSAAWPSPRTWDMAATLSAAYISLGYDEMAAFSSVVGAPAAREFLQYKKHMDLPNPEELLANPKNFTCPAEADKTFAILSSITATVISKNTQERQTAAWTIINKVIEAKRVDLAAIAAQTLINNKPESGYKVDPKILMKFINLLKNADVLVRA